MAARINSAVPGTPTWAFDESTFLWNTWYFKHALLNLHSSPLHSELIWYPLGIDLILYTFNFFNAIVSLPLLVAIDLPLASNSALLLATALSGFGAYLLSLYLLRAPRWAEVRRPAALVAGLVYAFGANRAVYAALGHYDMVTTQWLPFYALYLLKTLARPRLRPALMAGLFFALAALAEMIFASFLALLSAVLLLASWKGLHDRRRALLMLGVAAVTAAVIWSPVLAPVAREFTTADYALTGWGESVKLSADLQGLVTPTELNPLWRAARGGDAGAEAASVAGQAPAGWIRELRAVEEGKGRFQDINTVFLGYATLLLAVVGAWWGGRRARPWAWTAAVFGVLALGPLLQIGGRYRFAVGGLLPEGVTFPLPFTLLHFIPFISANRAPNRNSVILMLGLAALAAFGLAYLLRALGNRPRAGERNRRLLVPLATVAAAAVLLEQLAVPLPVTRADVPEVYRQIANEPGQFTVLQLPLGWRDSFGVLGSEMTLLQYYQAYHGKPMLGGNISRAPAYKKEYFARIPLFRALTDLEMGRTLAPEVDAAARSSAAALMAFYDVRYVVTYPPIPGRYPYQDTWQATEAYLREVAPLEAEPFWEGDGVRAYRVQQPAIPSPFRLDIGLPGEEPYLARGFDLKPGDKPYNATAHWITETSAEVYLPAAAGGARVLRLGIAPLSVPGREAQRLTIAVNDETVLRDAGLAPGWQTVEAAIPEGVLQQGANRVRLSFDWALSPRTAFPDAASRAVVGATGTVSPANLDLHAFSEAFMTVAGASGEATDISAGRRGYNVAVLDEKDGRLLQREGFDTAANEYEAERLGQFLEGIARGRIVAVATKGDAGAHMTLDAVAALRSLGSGVEGPESLAGMAHALVGIKGAAPGSAAEQLAPGDASLRVAGDFRTLAAALDWIELKVAAVPEKSHRAEYRQDLTVAHLVGLAGLALYLVTLAPGVLPGDSGEFQFAAWLAGFVHPTGYPLYLMLGWLWSHLLPLGNPAWRMNAFSAVWGAATLALVYLLAVSVLRQAWPMLGPRTRRILALVAPLTLGVGATYWSQSTAAEVYTLHAFLTAGVLLGLVVWSGRPARSTGYGPLYWAALLFGLGMAHHRSIGLLVPGIALFLLEGRRRNETWRVRLTGLARAMPLLLLPLLLYLYVPLRAPAAPYFRLPLSATETLTLYDTSFAGFVTYVLGQTFSSQLRTGPAALEQIGPAAAMIARELTIPGLALALLGAAALRRSAARPLFALTAVSAAALLVFNLFYGIGDIKVFYIPHLPDRFRLDRSRAGRNTGLARAQPSGLRSTVRLYSPSRASCGHTPARRGARGAARDELRGI